MSAKLNAAEALGLATGLVSAWTLGDTATVTKTVAALDPADRQILTVAALRVCSAMLAAEAEATNADPDAPAARAFWVASRAVHESARD